jgi:hypothetical protein
LAIESPYLSPTRVTLNGASWRNIRCFLGETQ